jgi:hypothetical protein
VITVGRGMDATGLLRRAVAIAAAVALLTALYIAFAADSRAASKPPAPAGARVLAPGQLPHQCKEGDAPYGHYWNVDTKQ